MSGQLINNELESIWKEGVIAQSKYLPSNCPDGVKKNRKHIDQGSWCCGRDSNQGAQKYRVFHKE
jgi:hypothetical protein